MKLEEALKAMFAVENSLLEKGMIYDPVGLSIRMTKLSQYASAVEERLAEHEQDFEIKEAICLGEKLKAKIPITRAVRECEIEMAEHKGQIKYLTRIVSSAWKQIGVVQSRINHLSREASTQP